MISEISTTGGQLVYPVIGGEPLDFMVYVPRQSGLLVPQESQSATLQPIADVRTYLQRRSPLARWELERALFHRLPSDLRAEVKRLQAAVLFALALAGKKNSVQAACVQALAIYPEFQPLKTFRAKYDLWRARQDWLLLVNRAKAGAVWQSGTRGLADRFLDYVAARMGDFRRDDAGEQAILSIHRQWATGRNHRGEAEVIPGYEQNWELRLRALLPEGWHPSNIRKQLKARNKFSKAVKKLRHEGSAAARTYLPQVHSTREGLRFMELVQFDDVRCDFRVIDTVTGQICDLWLLVARDVATTMLLGFGMRPALARDDGSQEHLKLQDMKQLSGWMLETYGLPPWVMKWVLENGTATLGEAVRAALGEMLGDRIDFQMASMISGKSSAGFWEKAVGNSKAKAMLESLNRLQHMMASHFPGQIGLNYGKRPTELLAREAEAKEIWAAHRAEDRAALAYPVLTIPQAREKLFEIFRQQNQRTDHTCEGFAQVVEWFDGQQWQRSNPPSDDCKVRARMESPMERAATLVHPIGEWSRVSPEIITAFYAHTQRRRPVEANGEIQFSHEGKVLRFTPPAPEFALAPETKCLCYFNPDDPRFLTLTDGRGGILGTWLRRGLTRHDDADALSAAIRHSATALKSAKARATDLAAGELASLDAMRAHNRQVAGDHQGFVTVCKSEIENPKSQITSSVAGALRAVAGEKAITKKQQQSREADERIAREALEL